MFNVIKQSVVKLASLAGYEVFPKWKMLELDLARFLQRFLKQYDIQVIVDVGANNGGYHNFLRQQVGYQGVIISFEPIQSNFDIIKVDALQDPSWHVYHCALGRNEETKVLNIMRSHDFSSFLEPDHNTVDDFEIYNVVERTETVTIKTLNKLLPELQHQYNFNKCYLKMDTQGFDLEVFAGAEQVLEDIIGLQSEVSIQSIYKEAPDYQQSIGVYTRAGFELAGLIPVNHDKYLRVIEFDCIMINSHALKVAQ